VDPNKAKVATPVEPGKLHKKNKLTEKTPVLSLINADTGEVRSAVVPDVTGATLRKVMSEQINMAGSVLWTDEANHYRAIGREFIRHETVNHSEDIYVNDHGAGTNLAEGYFAQFKRSIDGTHHRVSREHLQRYLTEFDFRYSTCEMSEAGRMAKLVDGADGRRLSYKRVKG